MKPYSRDMISRDIINHNVFRTAIHVFRYEDMSLTVLHESPSNGAFVQHLMFVQRVNSKKDAVDFIDGYLGNVGTR
jgi:hypothetical protein